MRDHLRDLNVPVPQTEAIQFVLHITLGLPFILRSCTKLMQLATASYRRTRFSEGLAYWEKG